MGAQSLPVCLRPDTTTMFIRSALLLAVVCILVAEGQNNRRPNRRQNRRPNQRQQNRNRGVFGRNGVTRNGARDARGTEVYPGCSGKVCLPEAQLCAERKQKAGHMREVWTSGRLCDKEVDGCEADRFQPYNIRG